ncbi:MAG: pimeloyl-ACP methyl ester carboxylesterase [Candidatus Poriferisodalaceae bacterium]|jgi:pimeloyl-ACP methyl ester carboxylesterase
MVALDGSPHGTQIDGRYTLYAPGFEGSAELHDAQNGDTRAARRDLFPTVFGDAFAREQLIEIDTIELQLTPGFASTGSAPMRGATGEGAMVLEMPARSAEFAQVVLSVDESGVATWHFAGPDSDAEKVRFLIRAPEPRRVDPNSPTHRGLLGLGTRVLKTFVYKLADPVIGAVAQGFAGRWEANNRSARLRSFAPGAHRASATEDLTGDDLERLGHGRSLLFVHGTFSQAHTGFQGVSDALLQHLHDVYGDRVFAYDHPTLSCDPLTNAAEFFDRIPDGVELDVDIVSHSRGGLVARTLAGEHPEGPAWANKLKVGKVVFAGAPNRGTVLVVPEHIPDLIDRYTTLLNLLPLGPVGEVLDAIVTVVKMIGHGVLDGLEGLGAMDPAASFLQLLDPTRATAEYYGLAANFEPVDAGLMDFLKNGAIDKIFSDAANDLVVPTEGVDPSPDLVMKLHRFEAVDAVHHSGYFAAPRTDELLREWLTG